MTEIVDLLEYPLYSLNQVDDVLQLPGGTARRWIEGYERRGKDYLPVVRERPTGSEVVTWGEFVETRFLAEYRGKGVPILNMRPVIEELRDRLETRYPLAIARPFVAGRELVEEVQTRLGLDRALLMVVMRNGQYLLTGPTQHFVRSVEFEDDGRGIARRLHPVADNKAVTVDPLRQFGEPVVRSVPTLAIAEQFDAGESVELIADSFDLSTADVQAALRYQRSRNRSSAAA